MYDENRRKHRVRRILRLPKRQNRTSRKTSGLPEQFFKGVLESAIGFDDVQAGGYSVERENVAHLDETRRRTEKSQNPTTDLTLKIIINRAVINVKQSADVSSSVCRPSFFRDDLGKKKKYLYRRVNCFCK